MKKTTLLIAFINLAFSSFSQNVGIGLTTPAAKRQINSTSTSSRPLLLLSDSSDGVSNTIEFTKLGNIGIGTKTPTEKLDVNGSINVSKTIKANGVAGQPGQVLSLNSNGNIAWSDLSEFKNHRTFTVAGSTTTWTVPADVTRIMIEGWGGGAGGSDKGGGGGGAYVCGWYTVKPGDVISFYIGLYGYGGLNTGEAQHGGNTTITTPTETIVAWGGKAAITTGGQLVIGKGGDFSVGSRAIGISGEDAQPNRIEYHQSNATTFLDATLGGKGGDAGNRSNTGSTGGYRLYNSSTSIQIKDLAPNWAKIPGGGGGGHYRGLTYYCAGAQGMVVIHY